MHINPTPKRSKAGSAALRHALAILARMLPKDSDPRIRYHIVTALEIAGGSR